MSKLFDCSITFIGNKDQKSGKSQTRSPLHFRVKYTGSALPEAARLLGLASHTPEHFALKNVRRIYCDGRNVFSVKQEKRDPWYVNIRRKARRNGWQGFRPVAVAEAMAMATIAI